MPSYSMYMTVDHRGDCTKAKVQYTSNGDTNVFYIVEDPEFITPASAFKELQHAIEAHRTMVIESRSALQTIKDDDGAL